MTTHIHTFAPGASVTCEATADIIGGRLVELTGDRRVAHTQAGSAKTFGAAGTDAKTGDDVLVLRGGIQRLVAGAAIPFGTRIKPAAAGKVVAVANGENGIGLTITTTTAADQLIHVALD